LELLVRDASPRRSEQEGILVCAACAEPCAFHIDRAQDADAPSFEDERRGVAQLFVEDAEGNSPTLTHHTHRRSEREKCCMKVIATVSKQPQVNRALRHAMSVLVKRPGIIIDATDTRRLPRPQV
jgi:hypothetical protein